ncbi:MAG: outer membrane beta-barrel protein [bacterium]
MKKTLMLLLIMFVGIATVAAAQITKAESVASKYKVDYWLLQASGGVGIPIFDSGNYLDPGFAGGVSVRKALDLEFSFGGGISVANLAYKEAGTPGPFFATILQLEGVYAPYLPGFVVWPYLKVGIGMWLVRYNKLVAVDDLQQLNQTAFGYQAGLGASYPFNNVLAANLEVLYNQASIDGGTGNQYSFITITAGLTLCSK